MGEASIKPLIALEFLRAQIEKNLLVLGGIERAAISFGIRQALDGLTNWQTIYITAEDVRLEAGAAPITYDAPLALIHTSESSLSAITSGESNQDIVAEGDTELLSRIAKCFDQPKNWLDLRTGR